MLRDAEVPQPRHRANQHRPDDHDDDWRPNHDERRCPTTTSTTTTTVSATSSGSTTTTSTSTTPSLGTSQGQTSATGGGGQTGLLLISPWVKPGTSDPVDYFNHFSLLASIEEIFNLKRLGYANQLGLATLTSSVFDGRGPKAG